MAAFSGAEEARLTIASTAINVFKRAGFIFDVIRVEKVKMVMPVMKEGEYVYCNPGSFETKDRETSMGTMSCSNSWRKLECKCALALKAL